MPDDRLTELYRTYGPVIYDRCRTMLKDDAEAEDATHETFLRLHRHLDRLAGSREALYWIYRVASNYCLNELRNRKRRAEPTDQLPEAPPELPQDVDRVFADRQLVRKLIASAPAKVREVAWLHHVDGLDREEVARVLDVSLRTVAARLADFSASVNRLLEKGGP